jgi:2-desacetyl-2-hydroxyethyl bacteriochlorophyllide A dehydrogenase
MQAMVLREFNEPLSLENVPDPICGPEDVILAVQACGVCGTDLKIRAGKVESTPLPHILGHEIAGVVVETGRKVTGIGVGDKACAHFYVPCDNCEHCRAGRTNLCTAMAAGKAAGRLGFEWPGGYAEYVRVPARVVVPLPPTADLETICITADAIATPYHALHQRAQVTAGQTLVLLGGAGGLGIHGLQIARAAGASVIVVDRGTERLQIAREFGADECIDTAIEGAWEDFLGRGRFADAIIDFAGSPALAETALSLVKARGRFVIVGYQYDTTFAFPYQPAMRFELEIFGSRASTMVDLRGAIELILSGKVQPVVGMRLPLSRANEALDRLPAQEHPGRTVLITALQEKE